MTNDEAKGLTDDEVNNLTEEDFQEIIATTPADELAAIDATAALVCQERTPEEWETFLDEIRGRYDTFAASPSFDHFTVTIQGVTLCVLAAEVSLNQGATDASRSFIALAELFRKLRVSN